MINPETFSKQLKIIMEHYQLSSASFADKINVQRSSISHILSGRNKPSLEFVLKTLDNFNEVTLDWLIYNKGNFPNEDKNTSQVNNETKKTNYSDTKEIERIIIFYNDGTFENYNP